MDKEKFTKVGNKYSVLDAFRFFFLLVITIFCASLVYDIVLSIIASAKGISIAELNKSETVQVLSFVISPVVFMIFFFVYNKVRKIKFKEAVTDGQKISLLPISVAIVLAIIAIFLFTPFMNLIDYWFAQMGYQVDSSIPMEDKMKSSVGFFFLGLLIYALLPAIAEEIVFRGVICKSLNSKYSGFVTILLSTVLFVLVHGSLQQTCYQFIVGIMLGYLAVVGGNIIYSIILHFLSNALVLVFGCFDIVAYLSAENAYYFNIYSMIFPICIFLLGLALVGMLFWVLKYLRNKNFFRYVPTKSKKKIKKRVQVQEEPKIGIVGFWKNLAYNEKVFMIVSFVLVGLIWIVNTISGFMGS